MLNIYFNKIFRINYFLNIYFFIKDIQGWFSVQFGANRTKAFAWDNRICIWFSRSTIERKMGYVHSLLFHRGRGSNKIKCTIDLYSKTLQLLIPLLHERNNFYNHRNAIRCRSRLEMKNEGRSS